MVPPYHSCYLPLRVMLLRQYHNAPMVPDACDPIFDKKECIHNGEDSTLDEHTYRTTSDFQDQYPFADDEPDESWLSWRSEVLKYWCLPEAAVIRADSGTDRLRESANLIRLNIQAARSEPYRQRFTALEADNHWAPLHYLFFFREAKPYTYRYILERAEEPHRSRIRLDRDRKPQARDITSWKAAQSKPEFIFAYPERMPGSVECSVDWTSAPDRYAVVIGNRRPEAAWLRCFRFFAYPATKFHFLERVWPTGSAISRSYCLVAGHLCPIWPNWYCLFAFFAFDTPVPCANRYTAQASEEGACPRMRVGMTPSFRSEWQSKNSHVFHAFDVPVPGSARFDVQYRVRDGSNAEMEQNRISIAQTGICDGGVWLSKFAFYAHPAPTVDLEDQSPPDTSTGPT